MRRTPRTAACSRSSAGSRSARGIAPTDRTLGSGALIADLPYGRDPSGSAWSHQPVLAIQG